jgi:hypothetical protein
MHRSNREHGHTHIILSYKPWKLTAMTPVFARSGLLLALVVLPFTRAFIVPNVPLSSTTIRISHYSKTPASVGRHFGLLGFGGEELANVVYDSCSLAHDAWDWTSNVGAPAALVAGAVLATLLSTREETAPRRSDSQRTRILKLSMRFLLLTSFAMETVSIFVSTMTGSVLLGHGEQRVASKMIGYASPLQLLYHHHE